MAYDVSPVAMFSLHSGLKVPLFVNCFYISFKNVFGCKDSYPQQIAYFKNINCCLHLNRTDLGGDKNDKRANLGEFYSE